MSLFEERHHELLTLLLGMSDPQARLSWVIDQAARATSDPGLGFRCEANELKGCASRLWISGVVEGGHCRFLSDSESAILKALARLICDLYDGLTPHEVVACEPRFIEAAGLANQLTENRRKTVRRVREWIRAFAAARLDADSLAARP